MGAFAIILNRKKEILLCHRRDMDIWNLPGGTVEKGESPWDAVIREVKEETGLGIVIEKLYGIYFKKTKEELVLCFITKVITGKIKITDEADVIRYFPLDRLPLNIYFNHIERIKDALMFSKTVLLKTQ